MACSILLVDDNEAYTDNIKDILEDENYLVKTTNSGEAACEMAHIVNQALDESAYTMLPKPIDVKQLLKLLDHVSQNPSPGAEKKPSNGDGTDG